LNKVHFVIEPAHKHLVLCTHPLHMYGPPGRITHKLVPPGCIKKNGFLGCIVSLVTPGLRASCNVQVQCYAVAK